MALINPRVENGYLIIPGQALVRVGAIISVAANRSAGMYQPRHAVEIRHGGKGFTHPTIDLLADSKDEAKAWQLEIEAVLATPRHKER